MHLCDYFFNNQKNSIIAGSKLEFEGKLDKKEHFKAHEVERLYYLFAHPASGQVTLKLPIQRIKENLILLAQLTAAHGAGVLLSGSRRRTAHQHLCRYTTAAGDSAIDGI